MVFPWSKSAGSMGGIHRYIAGFVGPLFVVETPEGATVLTVSSAQQPPGGCAVSYKEQIVAELSRTEVGRAGQLLTTAGRSPRRVPGQWRCGQPVS